jgi:cyclophilin family peptidyl-prolyl cis-trans isomerase
LKNGPPDLNGKWSQLDGQYTNFGQVTDGMDLARKVVAGDKIKRITIKG